jgi:hypothetical protein
VQNVDPAQSCTADPTFCTYEVQNVDCAPAGGPISTFCTATTTTSDEP